MERLGEPTLLQTIRAHKSEVTCTDAFGGRLATAGGDRTLRLWRWAGGGGWQEEAVAKGAHRYGLTATRWSPAGALLASGGVDGALRVWCGRTLVLRRTLAAPNATSVRGLCWASGARLLSGHDDGALCVWHVPRAAMLSRLVAHQGALHAITTLARGALVLTACTEGVLKVFDLVDVCNSGTTGIQPSALTWIDGAHDMGAQCADAAVDGRVAATGGHDAQIKIWRAVRNSSESGPSWIIQASGTLEGHAATVTAVRWGGGRGAEILASAALDRTARLWLPAAGTCIHVVHAHPRYLTSVALAPDLRYMVTGSNDKSARMWSLGTLTIDNELEPVCAALSHFGLGDLEGIGPVDDDVDNALVKGEEGADENGSRRVWYEREAHTGAINCISVHGDSFATASSSVKGLHDKLFTFPNELTVTLGITQNLVIATYVLKGKTKCKGDGQVKIFEWHEGTGAELVHTLEAHEYPALACDFGAGGALLLTAGLDGCACVWDVQMGCILRSLTVPTGAGSGGDAGGGGVRGARVSPHRPPLLLLVTDDGLAPVWSLADPDPQPVQIYGGHAEAATCCAWTSDGRVLATGAASGELVLHAPPPANATLHVETHAHELGLQSCDFAPNGGVSGMPEQGSYLLATAGGDSLIKLWMVEFDEECMEARLRLVRQVEGHGGGVACVRWGANGLLASAGGDLWARVWCAAAAGATLEAVVAVPVNGAGGAGGAPAVALLATEAEGAPLLAVGALSGELALWRLPADGGDELDVDDGEPPRFWDEAAVVRWLYEYITRVPGAAVLASEEARLETCVHKHALTGSRLLDDSTENILALFELGPEYDESIEKSEENETRVAVCKRIRDELEWLRRDPPPFEMASEAPHGLLCPVSHRVLECPARAADGFTYDRGAARERLLAAEGASPASGRRLRNLRLHPNYALRDTLRAYLDAHTQ